jgi:thiol:disulfide interchange protein DsbC
MTKTNDLALRLGAALLAAATMLPARGASPDAPRSKHRPAPEKPGTVPADLAARLKALYPATRIGSLSATPWPGVYEVVMGANIAYTDRTGRHFLFGHLYDMQARRDLTAERTERIAQIDFASLPLADALTEKRGSGARTLAVFSDPDCPYCRKLETALEQLQDVTIHTFVMPLASLHPEATAKAVAIWCAEDRIDAWHNAMRDGTAPPAKDCDHPIARNVALGERLGITGTPTLIASDGRVLQGAASTAQLDAWLKGGTTSATTSARRTAPKTGATQ